MQSSQNSFSEYVGYVTPSDIIEFLYCKRFIYFMKCLGIKQNEDKRYKVQLGKNLHNIKEGTNRNYLRKKIGSIRKLIEVPLISEKHMIKGKVDEVNFLEDGTAAPLDYKFAVYKDITFKTYKTQMILYSIMVEEMFDIVVNKGYLVYCRGGNELIEVSITSEIKVDAIKTLEEYKKVLTGYYPTATRDKAKCIDCCYRNICIS